MDRQKRTFVVGGVITAGLALSGCSSSIADLLHAAGAAVATKDRGFLPVNDLPPDRDETAISPAERANIQAELIAARDRQALAAAAQNKPSQTAAPK